MADEDDSLPKTLKSHQHRPESPALSCVSMESDRSKGGDIIDFKDGHHSTDQRPHQHRPESPALSCVSMESDRSKGGDIIDFKDGHHSTDQRPHQHRPESPALSCVSMESDRSKGGDIIDFKDGHHSTDQRPHQHRPESPALSCVSIESDRSKGGDIIDFKDGHHSTDQRPHQHRPESPALSCVSMESDRSKGGDIIDFKDGHHSTDQRPHQHRPESPALSCVSIESDRSKGGDIIDFKDGHHSTDQRPHQHRPESPALSCVSMESDRSKGGDIIDFKDGHHSTDQRPHQHRPESPALSCVSIESDRSKGGDIIDFKDGHHSTDQRPHQHRPESPALSCVSMESDRSKGGDIIDFKDGHHSTDQRAHQHRPESPALSSASSGDSDCSKDGDIIIDFKDGHHSTDQSSSPEGLVSSSHGHQSMAETTPLNAGLSIAESRSLQQTPGDPKDQPGQEKKLGKTQKKRAKKLSEDLKKSIVERFDKTIPETPITANLYIIDNIKGKENEQEGGQSETTSTKKKGSQTTYEKIFKSKSFPKEKVRTVLTTGNAGIGKTVQSQQFMVDWAKGKSNKDITFLFPLNFGELNSRIDDPQSLEELLHDSFKDNIAFILDGLDQCQLPLDFDKNPELTDIGKKASVDVLLTNLIKGNLLPSARLWITSRPSAAKRIPLQYIDTVTECGDEYLQHCLQSHLKKTILEFEKRMPKDPIKTPIYITDKRKEKESKEQEDGQSETKGSQTTYDKIFESKSSWFSFMSPQEKVKRVLTTGNAGIGKTLQSQQFMVDWAKGKSNKDVTFLFPLNFGELNSRIDDPQSLEELLHNLFKDAKQSGIPSYEKHNITFILDGLDQCQLPLDFDKNPELTDIREKASVDVLLTNLIKGNLLPSARLWITSRPSAAGRIPLQYIDTVTECGDKHLQLKLAANQKKRIREKLHYHLSGKKIDTHLHILEADMKEANNDRRDGQIQTTATKQAKQTTYDKLFQRTGIRTMLTNGVAGIGKTFQTQKYMLDWAEENSSNETELLFSLKFAELNSRADKDQSFIALLNDLNEDAKQSRVTHYDKYKVTFILDGLNQCQLPLNFNNPDLTDIRESASVDVLLTNLIKGNLLPSARLWITSQPSAAYKIPLQYIDTVTECRESLERRQQLLSNIKKRVCEENFHTEDPNHPNQTNTEHIIRIGSSEELNKDLEMQPIEPSTAHKRLVMSVPDMFQPGENGPIKTVLTNGEADIGKTFLVQKSILEWARGEWAEYMKTIFGKDETEGTEIIFPMTCSNLQLKENLSLVGLLNHCFEETKKFVLSNYAEVDVMFIFDGLDHCQLPLDFDKNPELTDTREEASVDVLLTNLIKGNLLPSARIWITTRPEGARKIVPQIEAGGLSDTVGRLTEIREKPDVASQRKLKSFLIEKFLSVFEGLFKHTNSALLNEIYTELYIIEGATGVVGEVMKIEEAAFKPEETPILYFDIFNPRSGQEIRTVLTNGVAGVGKTIASQKYMLDWAKGESNQDTYYTFPFLFRELNLKEEQQYSLEGLIHEFFPEMRTSEISNYDKYKILLVLDGLDECKLDLNFNSDICTNVREKTSVNVLLVNLIRGKLLPNARLWITSRHAASSRIPPEHVDLVTEVRGFKDPQKEEYFRKRCSDKDLANKIISHLRKSRSLYTLCQIPVFCWIAATVLEYLLRTDEKRGSTEGEMPTALTDMLIHFLVLQCRQGCVKYHEQTETSKTDERDRSHDTDDSDGSFNLAETDQLDDEMDDEQNETSKTDERDKSHDPDDSDGSFKSAETDQLDDETDDPDSCWISENRDLILALGKLAFEELEKCNMVFVEEDLTSRGIDLTEAAVYSGLFTQISRDDDLLFQTKMYCFVHLSIQEFMAALFDFLKFSNGESYREGSEPAYAFYKCAVDKALANSNGHWDLFLRFLLGLLRETNHRYLHGILKLTRGRKKQMHKAKPKIIAYIKEKISGALDADRSINLFHCLNDLGDHSLVEEIKKKYLSSDNAPYKDFSSSQWSALTYVLLMSDEKLDEFDLKKYLKSEQVLLGMLPIVKVAKTALLSWCDLSHKSCEGLAYSILSSSSANLTELDLSDNDLEDLGIKELSEGLRMPQCKLEILKLSGCQVTEKGCSFLGSALKSNPNHLRELDLSYNHPGDSGGLTAIQNDQETRLETLRLDHGGAHRLRPGRFKYGVDLTLDINTASQKIVLSEGNRKARRKTKVEEDVRYPDHPDRFSRTQVLCEQGLTERCYFEVELRGSVGVGAAYRLVSRGWDGSGGLGSNDASWSLVCPEEKSKFTSRKPPKSAKPSREMREFVAWHGKEKVTIEASVPSQKIAVFLDLEGGTLEYYSVSTEGALTHIHTFQAQFTEPLYPGFWFEKGSVSLCQVCGGDDPHAISA